MRIFHPPKSAINRAMDKLMQDGLVHSDASFNYDAERGLRKEVSYRDSDFQYRLARSPEEETIIDAACEFLVSLDLIPSNSNYNKESFMSLRSEVKSAFKGSWTSITPVMERLMYMLTAVKKPECLVELGSFWGNTLAWFAGPCIGRDREYAAERIYGIDIDVEMTKLARDNFSKLDNSEAVTLIGEDAATAIPRIDGPIDILYLEAKDENNKSGYLQFLQLAYDKLPKGAWVIAHDSTHYDHQKDIKPYLDWVRDTDNFTESISFDIDQFGLELSIK